MGIKFHCPNGHKLNVKAFLAGKKGVCPKCGTRFRIPAESEPGLVDSDLEEGDAGASGIKPGNGTPVAAQAQPVMAAAAAGSQASLPPSAPASAVPGDPIAEGPQLVWYVRPPSGGQFGPAKGEIMRTWLTEGRVTGDSLVWREGWTDWQTAGTVFPTLHAGATPQHAAPAPLAGLTTTAAPKTIAPQAGKRGTSGMAIAILVGLGLLCLVLVVVLAIVLTTVK
jgi:hypothetical protein